MKTDRDRNYGIDLLRIVAMFLIVIGHLLYHGGILTAVRADPGPDTIFFGWNIFAACGVNCFALISGYVGYNADGKYANIFHLILQVAFYGCGMTLLGIFLGEKYSCVGLVGSCFFSYWYINAYYVTFFLMPFVNTSIKNMVPHQIIISMIAFLLFFCFIDNYCHILGVFSGYNFMWLTFLYCLGACFCRYRLCVGFRPERCLILYFLAGTCAICLAVISHHILHLKWRWLTFYTSPLILTESLALFIACKNLCIPPRTGKVITVVSSFALGVYLIHDHPVIRRAIIEGSTTPLAEMAPICAIGIILGYAILIYLVCTLIDCLRWKLFAWLRIKPMCCVLENGLLNKIDHFLTKHRCS